MAANNNIHGKKSRPVKIAWITVLSLLSVALIAGVILIVLLLQDNVSHKYSADPNLDALTKMVEMGGGDEVTLSPQEMTDTVAYFLPEEISKGKIRFNTVYFDVAEDQQNALLIIPFQYGNTDLVLQLNAAPGIRTVTENERYFEFTVNQVKIGEVVIPPGIMDRLIQDMNISDDVTYQDGVFLVDASVLSVDILGKKSTLKILDLAVAPEGFRLKTESLGDFLIGILSDYFG